MSLAFALLVAAVSQTPPQDFAAEVARREHASLMRNLKGVQAVVIDNVDADKNRIDGLYDLIESRLKAGRAPVVNLTTISDEDLRTYPAKTKTFVDLVFRETNGAFFIVLELREPGKHPRTNEDAASVYYRAVRSGKGDGQTQLTEALGQIASLYREANG